MSLARSLVLIASCFFSMQVAALIETYDFTKPELQVRYRLLSAELRCPKCQNQNIADSDAPIAQDLRRQLHRQLEEGASDEQILDYMVARYGEFVRYRPSFAGVTVVLWLAPVLLFFAAVAVLLLTLRSKRSATAASPEKLTAEEEKRVANLLNRSEQDS